MTSDVLTQKALVLDFGGVISKTLFETHDLTETALGLPPGSLSWQGPFDPANDSLWRDMQAGTITERDYWLTRAKEVGAMLGQDWHTMKDFVVAARGSVDPLTFIRSEAIETIVRVKEAGHRLAILSNELDLFYGADFRQKLPFLADFELIVDASYTKVLKPDPRAYAMITDGLALQAQDCIFVDDQMKNINGGVAAGMTTVWFDVMQPKNAYSDALGHFGLPPLS